MRVLVQRVSRAAVDVEGCEVAGIGRGLLLLVGFARDDTAEAVGPMARRVVHLRVFPDDRGRMDRSVLDVGGGVLAVPQFTLYANTRGGRRPDFGPALPATPANDLFERFVDSLAEAAPASLGRGVFGADMQVSLVNDGPVTLLLES